MQLTPHFNLSEFVRGDDLEQISEETLDNVYKIAQCLEVIRCIINKPIHITSGYRTPDYNFEIGGHPNSYHVRGMAADVVVNGMPARELQKLLKHWSGGLGSYETFTHIDIGPKRRWGS